MPTLVKDNQSIGYLSLEAAPLFSIREDDASIVSYINEILKNAVLSGSSDIHFEPYEQKYRIRYRQDGILTEIAYPPLNLAARISSRLKVMANLDIAERRRPQDGGFQIRDISSTVVDCRISTCPTINGEKVVVRIFDRESLLFDLASLGLNNLQKNSVLQNLQKPQGLILITGPTGSGKTITLYSALQYLNNNEKNISTVEDPVEIRIPGINQVNINSKAGLTFGNVLRSLLRQDPDILMIGEIRDLETAELAIKAAQTGHLVLATLHSNSAADSLTRLINLGVPAFNLANSINLLIAQRLARRLCKHCELKGCINCTKGYSGRLGLFEVMPISFPLRQLILAEANPLDIFQMAQNEGMLSLYQSGLEKVKEGLTTLNEINRVALR